MIFQINYLNVIIVVVDWIWVLSIFVTINTGEIIPFPEQEKINRLYKKIKRLQKKTYPRKKKGSNNYKKRKKENSKSTRKNTQHTKIPLLQK